MGVSFALGDRVTVREKARHSRPRGAAPTGTVCQIDDEWSPLVRVDFSTKYGPELKAWFREDELEAVKK